MGFVQIISFRTDRYDQITALEQKWLDATDGRRTALRQQSLVDRSDPRHHVHVVEFASYEAAMVNSNLPETDALAQELAAVTDGTEFGDYDIVVEFDERRRLAEALRDELAVGAASADVFAADVAFEGQWPEQVVRGSGPGFIAESSEGPLTIDRWEVTTTETGFVAEYRYRTNGEVSYLSQGIILATVERGRISRIVVTCGGSWDAAAQERILGAVSA